MAIISDIHGHLEGLEIVLRHIETQAIDEIICLGDLVEGGEHNDAVVERIRTHNIKTVRGNHDEFNDCKLKLDNQQWLTQLPNEIHDRELCFTHISPRSKPRKLDNPIEAWNVFDETDFRLYFIGHNHFPALFGERHDTFGEACNYPVDVGCYELDADDRYIVSFGAIGYPRGGGKFLRYGILDSSNHCLEFIRLEGPLLPYGLCG